MQATLGVAMVVSGRTAAGLAALDAAARRAAEPLVSRVLVRRSIALLTLGRHQEALRDLHRAMTRLRQADDTIWVARALTTRGLVRLSLNDTTRAAADLSHAQRLFAMTGQEVENAYAWHNRGLVAFVAATFLPPCPCSTKRPGGTGFWRCPCLISASTSVRCC